MCHSEGEIMDRKDKELAVWIVLTLVSCALVFAGLFIRAY
jgi:hypothetical protein